MSPAATQKNMRRTTIAIASLGALTVVSLAVSMIALALEAGPGSRSFRNTSDAMEPALLAGDLFTFRPITARTIPALRRGALIVHASPPDPDKQFVKRIVARPGDTVRMESGVLHLNGTLVKEPYAWRADPAADPVWDEFKWQNAYLVRSPEDTGSAYHPSRNTWGPLAVPAGHYFVLGDNRDSSLDSRYWGLLPFADVLGTPRRVYFSRNPKTGAVRWSRMGHSLSE